MRAFGCAKSRKAFEHQTETVNVKWLFVGHSECAVQRYSKKQRENQCHWGSSFVIFGIDHKTTNDKSHSDTSPEVVTRPGSPHNS